MTNISNTIALAVASIFLAAIVGYVIWRGLAAVRRVGTFFLLFTVGMAFYGGSKGFWRSVNFPRTDLDVAYLTDNDSRVWSTNFVHLAFTPASMVPQDAQIYLDYRAAASTNDADWVTYTNATLAAFPNPLDFEFDNATNYSWMCYTTWTPGAAEVTNGIVRIGWMLPMDGGTNAIVMLRTGVRYKSPVPYVTDGLLGLYFGRDFDGVRISPAVGDVPPLELISGTVEKTTTGLRAVGGTAVFKSATIPQIVSVFDSYSRGGGGELSFEVVEDFRQMIGPNQTRYNQAYLFFATDDNLGNIQWSQLMIDITRNEVYKYFIGYMGSSWLNSRIALYNKYAYYPVSSGVYYATNGIAWSSRLFGNATYSGENQFYARSYSDSARARFINGAYLTVNIWEGVEFNRVGCWLKKLSTEEITKNQEADLVEFGFPQ